MPVSTDVLIQNLVKTIQLDQFSEIQLGQLSAEIGGTQSKKVFIDGLSFSKEYQYVKFLKLFKPNEWLSERNIVITSFGSGLICDNGDEVSQKETNALVCTVEQIYYLRNLNLISPASFRLNLLTYFVIGSKSAVTLSGATATPGSYATLFNTI